MKKCLALLFALALCFCAFAPQSQAAADNAPQIFHHHGPGGHHGPYGGGC